LNQFKTPQMLKKFAILPQSFVQTYKSIPVEFGFNGLGEIAY